MKTPRSSSALSPAPHLQLEAGSARTASLPHAPQDLSESWTAFLIYRAGEALMTAPFLPFLPLWMPLCWLALNFATNSAVQWIRKRPAYHQQPADRHLFTDRLVFLVTYGGAGTAAFFLYVPGNVGMLCILGICVVCVGVLSILQTAGDNWRGSIGAGLVILPTATRFLFEDGPLMPTLGLGGFILVAALTLLGRRQADAFMEQVELRQRAEHAADAVAGVGLAKARFFAAVSHDLRQPVHAIGLYLAALPDMVHDARGRKAVNGIHQALRVLDDMLSQVLDLTRMDSGGLQPQIQEVEVEPLLRGLAVQYSAAAERKSIRLVVLAAPRRHVLADSLMLKRSLSNLLDNAIKFSAEDGRIVMALRSRGNDWCVQVRDAGEGIHKDLHAKVFEEFVQIHNPERDRTRGVGLGLTIARRFVGLMQGHLRMRSAPGAGTCFSVLLPKASVPSPRAEAATAWVGEPQGSPEAPVGPEMAALQVPVALKDALARTGKAILLVEDDALVSEAIGQLFKDLGLPVVMAADASAAFALAHRACVAACDIRLPGELSGLELAVELQANEHMPCLLMTGETAADVRAAARGHNLPLLVKPIKPQTLLDELGSLCSGHLWP
jgi:signal transduction histidine kinase/CheY-like chemotaxis protein